MIKGETIEQVRDFKLLGVHVSDDLTWSANCAVLLKKSRQRLYFLRKLKNFGVRTGVLVRFYTAIIQSVLTNAIIVWFGNTTSRDLRKLSSVIRTAERIIGTGLPSLESVYNARIAKKTKLILEDTSHPANDYFNLLPSGRRLRSFYGNKRFTRSCYPSATRIFNSSNDLLATGHK